MSETHSPAMFAIWPVILLVLVAMGIGLQVYVRGRKEPARSLASRLFSALWVIPMLAVCVFVAARALRTMEAVSPVPTPAPAATEFISAQSRQADSPRVLPDPVQEWAEYAVGENGEPNHTSVFVVSSKQYATVDEADEQVRWAAMDKIREDFHRTHGKEGRWGHWSIPPHLVQNAIRQRHVEPVEHTTGTVDFHVYRVHAQVVIDPPLREELHRIWKTQISQRRLWTLGSLLGFATMLVGACAAYLRLDLLTNGDYRGRLKFATLALIVAGGLAAARLMPIG